MLILHLRTESRAALLLRKVMALKGCPYGWLAGRTALDPGPGADVAVQWGRRVFLGPVLGVIAIDTARPQPSLFPNGNRGMPLALDFWSETVARRASEGANVPAAHAALVARQLADGRAFLQGAAPGLADAEAWAGLVAAGHRAPAATVLAAWQARMAALGEGDARPVDAATAAAAEDDAANTALQLGDLARSRAVADPRFGALVLVEPLL